jgi:hypothetical protein
MLDDETIRTVSKHGFVHTMGMCTCPCFDALMAVGNRLKEERDLAAKIGSVSPIALAALMGADVSGVPDDAGPPESGDEG